MSESFSIRVQGDVVVLRKPAQLTQQMLAHLTRAEDDETHGEGGGTSEPRRPRPRGPVP